MEFRDMGLVDKFRRFNYRDLEIFLIPTIVFSFYLLVFYPGIGTYDTFNQIHQIASNHFTNWHPFFHTFIEMLCLKVYPSTVSICIFQILVFSTMWTLICKYNRNDCIEDKRTFKLQLITTIVISLIPINAIYSITMWKDILFSYLLMFLCFLAMVLIDKKGNVDFKFIILLSLVMAFISQLRGNGLYVIIISVIVYSIYLFIKRNIKMGVLLLTLTTIFILSIASLNIAYDVVDNEKDAVMTKISHMLADYDLNLEIEDADRNAIHELIGEEAIKEHYKPTDTDPILHVTNNKLFDTNRSMYINLAIKYSLKNPLHCMQYLLESAPMVWDITRDSNWLGRPYYMSSDRDRLHSEFEGYYVPRNYIATQPYENISYVNWGTPVFDGLNLLAIGIENSPFDTVFNSPALYMYLSIIILIAIHLITKSKEIYLMYIPNLLNIIVVFFSTPIQDNRYLYANLLVAYLLIIIYIRFKHQSRE